MENDIYSGSRCGQRFKRHAATGLTNQLNGVLNIALCSLDQAWENKEKNFAACSANIAVASNAGADIIVFPEMTLTGFSMNTEKIAEKYDNSASIHRFKELAKEYRIGIVFGISLQGKNKPLNSLVFLDKSGKIIARYSKLHTFSYAGENRYYSRGMHPVRCTMAGEKVGLTICYDLRFPELYQILSKNCSIIINIANWPKERIAHWRLLLKARAVEGQVFMVGVNRTGIDGNGLKYTRSSGVISPAGEAMDGASINSNLDLYSIDTTEVKGIRNRFPVYRDRRTGLYKHFL